MANPSQSRLRQILSSILPLPTAPFRESRVTAVIEELCAAAKIPLFTDSWGNLWLNARSLPDVRQKTLVFVAHIDHPGFVVERFLIEDGVVYARAKWLGGGPTKILGHHVKIFSELGSSLGDRVFDATIDEISAGPRSVDTARFKLQVSLSAREVSQLNRHRRWGACLWFSQAGISDGVQFGPHWGGRILTKGADDLVGVCALLEGFLRAQKSSPRGSNTRGLAGITCLLSRAEECGFQGSIGVLEKKWLNPAQVRMISIETSAALPGAEIGMGPVVRVGDRMSCFHAGFVRWIHNQALALQKKSTAKKPSHRATSEWAPTPVKDGPKGNGAGFQFQKRVMDGGTCEATAFAAYGFQVAGLSTPLGGYHNIGPDQCAVPEEVSENDVDHLTTLIARIMSESRELAQGDLLKLGFKGFRQDIQASFKKHQKYF